MGEAEVGVDGEFAGEVVPVGLGVGGEAEVEEFAKAMLVTYEVIESAIGFDEEGFLQPFPEWL